MDATPSIADLLPAARLGDRTALENLFLASVPYLQLLARSRIEHGLQAKFDGSDLVQQTLLEAYRAFPCFQGSTEAEWLAWLRRILAHNTADWVREYRTGKRRAQKEVPLEPGGDTFPGAASLAADSSSPSRVLLRKEQELRLAWALDQLSPDHREVVLLRNLERLPFSEIAQRMGRSRPAVQMLWMRALIELQKVLG